jgi:methylated-DNA-[protein]-cysteine S-methyltransferase
MALARARGSTIGRAAGGGVVTASVYGLIETRFGLGVAWLDGAGALVRFSFRAERDFALDSEPDAARNDRAVRPVARQIEEYAAGRRTRFDLPLEPVGSPFQNEVWRELVEIPYGTTVSYGELAERIGRRGAARAVGRANATNPIALIVPCHRVIGSSGDLTGYGGGLPLKRALLCFEREHVDAI